ncbi:hypothetical protein PENANT_c002G11300 [Penicillium antarcticum]|uniref:DUF7905 domain-containing protein n=1 Tax=Penicillium antarcticum TaxID=416450 RepID=A0A1V6QJJ5_9EURO|nr:hypothetical protein PENANT_c002G11300 [Penicillium antarcticum]
MAEADQPPEEDWEKLQAMSWSLPLHHIGKIIRADEDDQPSLALESAPAFKKGLVSLENERFPFNSPPEVQRAFLCSSRWGKRPTRQSTNIRDAPIQAQISPLAGDGSRALQPVRVQRLLTSVSHSQFARTPGSAIGLDPRLTETNTASQSTHMPVRSPAKDSVGKAKWRLGAGPDGYIRLPLSIDRFQDFVTQLTMKTGQPVTNFRDFVVNVTGAYLTVGYRGERIVLIWGDGNQVLAAHTLLSTLITQVNQKATGANPDWTLINSFSTAKVDVSETKDDQASRLIALLQAPDGVSETTLCFLWPSSGPSLDQCLASRRQLIDSIRLQYGINIYTKPGVWGQLYLSGADEHCHLKVAKSYRGLWKEMTVQHETEIRVFLLEPPPAEIMQKDVIMQNYSKMFKPYLSGLKLPAEHAESWEKKRHEARQDNKLIIVDRLKRALHFVPRFHGYRQMRAKFGSFVLKEYRKTDDTDGPLLYLDFRDMLAETKAKGNLLAGLRLTQNQLIKRVMGAGHLLVPTGNVPLRSLSKIRPRFSASFEYKISSDDVVRVEADYTLPRSSEEFEVNEIRCFKPRKTEGTGESEQPMQISMIDFERSDWQLEIKALDMIEEDTPPDVETFKRKLSFVWNESALSITSVPERMSKLPPGAPLRCFVEKSAIEFHVKGTNLVFELARFVRYNVTNGRVVNSPDVTWGGSLFNPDWDEILGQNAEIDPIQFTREACLSTFFPPVNGAEIDEEVQLGVFMSALRQIARMLGSPNSTVTKVLDANVGTLF